MHSGQNTEFLIVKDVVHKVSLRLQKVNKYIIFFKMPTFLEITMNEGCKHIRKIDFVTQNSRNEVL